MPAPGPQFAANVPASSCTCCPEDSIDLIDTSIDTAQERPDRLRLLVIGSSAATAEVVKEASSRGDWDFRYEASEDATFDVILLCGHDGLDPVLSCWSTEDVSADATLLAVLTEKQDTPRAWLQTGQELMDVLLSASALGINAAIMSLPPSSEAVKALIRPIAGCAGDPILLLRFGRPRRKLITPRRSPVDVMLHPGFRH